MAVRNRSVRFQDDLEVEKFSPCRPEKFIKLTYNIDGTKIPESSPEMFEQLGSEKKSTSLKSKVLSRVFPEDYERVAKKILDPRGPILHRWNKIFLVACLVSLFVDPLFLYLPYTHEKMCTDIGIPLEVALTIVRSIADVFYVIKISIQFRTAFVAPSSRVFGRGELVIDSSKIASRYLAKDFWIDLIAALPLLQVLIWGVIPTLKGSTMTNTKNVLRFSLIFQYLARLFFIFPLSSQIINATGFVTEKAWAGAAYNLILYMLASHVIGASWYLLSIERQEACWRKVCRLEKPSCQFDFLDCGMNKNMEASRNIWLLSSNITELCSNSSNYFEFGIYGAALDYHITSSKFFNKYFYCFWWGLQNLSSLGQNLLTSTYVGEIAFAIIIAILGLVLFGLLIGNMQTYLQSTTIRLEEWRIKRTDTEQWMRHRQLPQDLRQCIRRYDQYKWVATRGVDEEALLQDLPMDLRRDIKRHLCLDLVRRVPLFDEMDDSMLDAICERLKPALCTEDTCLQREGDPVNEMLFIIRGHLDSYTTNGGRTGFFDSIRIGPGDFCGEELLTWALDPLPSVILPSSTRTVKAVAEVEAFALIAEDLTFVASQFRRLHSKQLRQKFRFYSHQWRTWAVCFIQAAWRSFKKRKGLAQLRARESMELMVVDPMPDSPVAPTMPLPSSPLGIMYTARLAASTKRGETKFGGSGSDGVIMGTLKKPAEPDFTVEEELSSPQNFKHACRQLAG